MLSARIPPGMFDAEADRTVIVTGARGGIGRATVTRLARAGWNVAAVDNSRADRGSDPTEKRVTHMVGDVTDVESMRATVTAAAEIGPVRACIANAGVVSESLRGFLSSSPSSWRRTVEVNLLGTLNTFHAAAAVMSDAGGGGRLLATSSVAGLRSEKAVPVYGATKAGVNSLVKALAIELGVRGIAVNAVAPGPVSTEAYRELAGRQMASAAAAPHGAVGRPFERLASPDDVAGTFEWLLSDAAVYITGQIIAVDGGGTLA